MNIANISGLTHLAGGALYCCYCDCDLDIFNFTREHLVPKSKGGNGTKANLRPCCRQCNRERGNQPLIHWLEHLRIKQLAGKGNRAARDRTDTQVASIEGWLHYIEQQGENLFTDRDKFLKYRRNYSLHLY